MLVGIFPGKADLEALQCSMLGALGGRLIIPGMPARPFLKCAWNTIKEPISAVFVLHRRLFLAAPSPGRSAGWLESLPAGATRAGVAKQPADTGWSVPT